MGGAGAVCVRVLSGVEDGATDDFTAKVMHAHAHTGLMDNVLLSFF